MVAAVRNEMERMLAKDVSVVDFISSASKHGTHFLMRLMHNSLHGQGRGGAFRFVGEGRGEPGL